MSEENYTIIGTAKLTVKLLDSFKNGTEVAWLVHTGVRPGLQGKAILLGC
jgi:hypothetical protein